MSSDQYMSAEEAAEATGLSMTTIYDLVDAGALHAHIYKTARGRCAQKRILRRSVAVYIRLAANYEPGADGRKLLAAAREVSPYDRRRLAAGIIKDMGADDALLVAAALKRRLRDLGLVKEEGRA